MGQLHDVYVRTQLVNENEKRALKIINEHCQICIRHKTKIRAKENKMVGIENGRSFNYSAFLVSFFSSSFN